MSNGRWVGSDFAWVSEEKAAELSANLAFPGDIVFTQRGTLGQVCLVPDAPYEKYVLSQSQMKLRVNPAICDPLFMLYQFKSPAQQAYVDVNAIRVGVPHTNLGILRDTPCQVPPLSTQKAIAHILGTLDDKIELNRKNNETLEAMAKALFKSWFVDFDPVRAKSDGRPTGLPAEISDLFPDSFEDSELGEIPSGWSVGCLSDCCEITMGQSPPGDTYNEDGDGLPFYQGKTDFGFRFPGRRIYCSAPTRQASIGATLISVRAPVGSANIAREVCSIGRGIAALKSRQSADSFVYYLIGTLQGVFESYNSEGTVFGAINGKDLASIQIVVPSTAAIAAFNSQCFPMDESIQSNTQETEHLTTVRDALLPKLISGEIRIPDAEKMLEEVGV
jgi:type I restriction enzyme S subunit